MTIPADKIMLPPGSYYIGDLHMLTRQQGMYASARIRIENQALEAPGQVVAGLYHEHLYAAVSFPLQENLVRQYLVSNMGAELAFVRHTPWKPRKTGTLAVINFASLGPSVSEIYTELPALCWTFDRDTVADYNGHRLK